MLPRTLAAVVLGAALSAAGCASGTAEEASDATEAAFTSPSTILNPKFEPYVRSALKTRCPAGATFARAARCQAIERRKLHFELIESEGFGLYYGTEYGQKPTIPSTVQHPVLPSNCVQWLLESLAAGYVASGHPEVPATIAVKNGSGTSLLRSLQAKGWTLVYFNPDVTNPADGKPDWKLNYGKAKRGGGYYDGIDGPTHLSATIVNYAPNPKPAEDGTTTPLAPEGEAGIARLHRVPYYVGVVEGGTHTFVGYDGNVSEFHWDSDGIQKDGDEGQAIEVTPLEKWYHDEEDRRYGWSDGVVAIPPGEWNAAAN